jgi:ribosomal protein S18 acetylase RimI-like enzyme
MSKSLGTTGAFLFPVQYDILARKEACMRSFDIRPVGEEHLQKALRLVSDVFMAYDAPEYSRDGIGEFLRYIEYDSIKEMLDFGTLLMWVCLDNDMICGVIAVRPPGHISLLFVDSRYHKQGIARALFEFALPHSDSSINSIDMTVNSSPYALGFYRKVGFIETDTEQTVNGIRYVPMKRVL